MLKIGDVIGGKYKILNLIGKGGMSIVYLAVNEKANKQWAIKEIQKKNFTIPDMNQKEIEMMKRLKHPGLPSLVDVIEEKESLLIVMDYIEGRSLDDLLEEYGPQSEKTVVEWAKQLCDMLEYLHSREPPVIYRDMKPANVILKPDGHVALIDFGTALECYPDKRKDTVSLGTKGYAAPEQYESNGQSDARTDIYCLGVMLFQLLTGKSPYDLCLVRALEPNLSAGLEAVIDRCTRERKEERYQSCAELLYALEHYWESDLWYRRQQMRKMKKFLLCLGMTAALGTGACVFKSLESGIRESNYNAYVLAAQNAATKEEEIQNYRTAIRLNPVKKEAYLLLLENAFLDDNCLETSESELLRNILIDYGNRGVTNERSFQKNKKGYDEFAYQAGIAYFYNFREKSNKKIAKGYLKIASDSRYLEAKQTERAKRLYMISEYYSRIGLVDEAGDSFVTYRQYWDDLTALSEGNLVEADNERTALVLYEELAGQIVSRGEEFRKWGVEKEEMEKQLNNIRKHLETDFLQPAGSSQTAIGEEVSNLRRLLEQAEKMLDSVYERRNAE